APKTVRVWPPPPPQRATLPLALAPISRKLHLGRVRRLSRKTIEVPLASKKQSPPVRGIGSGMPSTLSQQLPRESMAKCAKSVGDIFFACWILSGIQEIRAHKNSKYFDYARNKKYKQETFFLPLIF